MRIAIDHQVTSLQDAGGMSRYHYELARHLRGRQGITLDCLLGAYSSLLPFPELAGAGVRVSGWRSRLPAGYARYAANALWTSAVAPARGRYDVYHATYQRWEPGIRHRCLVATHHDSTQERFPHLFRNAAAIRERKRTLYHRAAMVICVSQSAREDLLALHGVPADRIRVVHHGLTPLQPASPGSVPPEPPSSDAPSLLYVGSRSAYKNFLALLRAFAAAPPATRWRLHVAGGGPWSEAEQRALEELALGPRVALYPRVTDAELGRLYRTASLFCYPSLYEGFGFPPLEAMSAGCPVLASRTSSLPEICGDAAFYFDPAAPGSLPAELSRLLADDALRRSRVGPGLARAGLYTWETAAEATLEVYREALSLAGGASAQAIP